MPAALLLNPDLKIADWQLKCIDFIAHEVKYIYIAKPNTRSTHSSVRKLKFNHAFYYLLNLKSIRQHKSVLGESVLQGAEIRYLDYSMTSKGWADLDPKSIDYILKDSPEYIYKCGLSLLLVPPELYEVPIISHHHGNPSKYRGRPAGFYEMLNDEVVVGQIVQVLSNKLDAGRILAYGESKISAWSYKKTLRDAYELSPYVFINALRNLRGRKEVEIIPIGRNYRLPANSHTMRFLASVFLEKFKRLIYGTFYEKRWNVAFSANPFASTSDLSPLLDYARSRPQGDRLVPIDKKYTFYADSFLFDRNVLVEGLRRSDGVGELLELDSDGFDVLRSIRPSYSVQRHISYPYVYKQNSSVYIFPDSGEFDKPFLLKKDMATAGEFKTIEFVNSVFKTGITDPSVIYLDGNYYLFGNLPGETNILRLWVGDDPAFSNAIEHPLSPVHMGPRGSRCGGKIFSNNSEIFRLGQDFSRGYGNGLLVYKISVLTPASFDECLVNEIKFDHPICGPHTFDASNEFMCWDYYHDQFSLLAGYRRVVALLRSKIH